MSQSLACPAAVHPRVRVVSDAGSGSCAVFSRTGVSGPASRSSVPEREGDGPRYQARRPSAAQLRCGRATEEPQVQRHERSAQRRR